MRRRNRKTRNYAGSAITEFGPALAIFVIMFFVPLIDVGFIPIRYGTAYGTINNYVHTISRCEKMSDVANHMINDEWWRTTLAKCGVKVESAQLALRITNKGNEEKTILVPFGQQIPAEWLPNGNKGPYVYSLQLSVQTRIAPLFYINMGGAGIPGLTEPAPFQFVASSAWENLGRDPDTDKFFMSE